MRSWIVLVSIFLSGLANASVVWETVYTLSTEKGLSHFNWSLGIDKAGNKWIPLYIFTPNAAGTPTKWQTLVSAPDSFDFKVADEFELSKNSRNAALDFFASEEGEVFITGQSFDYSKDFGVWIVRKMDLEKKWSTLFDQSTLSIYSGAGFSTLTDKQVYLSFGRSRSKVDEPNHATLVKGSLDGTTATKVIKFANGDFAQSAAYCALKLSSGRLVASVGGLQGDIKKVFLYYSDDQGETWTKGSELAMNDSRSWLDVSNCSKDSKDRVYVSVFFDVAGKPSAAGGLFRSSDGGATAEMIDLFAPNVVQNVQPRKPAVDANGVIYFPIHGNWGDNLGYLVRASYDDGKTFSAVDTYENDDPENATGAGASAIDAEGFVWVTGYEEGSEGQKLIIRRQVQ